MRLGGGSSANIQFNGLWCSAAWLTVSGGLSVHVCVCVGVGALCRMEARGVEVLQRSFCVFV